MASLSGLAWACSAGSGTCFERRRRRWLVYVCERESGGGTRGGQKGF